MNLLESWRRLQALWPRTGADIVRSMIAFALGILLTAYCAMGG